MHQPVLLFLFQFVVKLHDNLCGVGGWNDVKRNHRYEQVKDCGNVCWEYDVENWLVKDELQGAKIPEVVGGCASLHHAHQERRNDEHEHDV